MNNFDYGAPPAPPSPELQKLTFPAIGLIVTGALNAFTGLLVVLSGLARLAGNTPSEHLASDAERLGYLTATFLTYGAALASLVLAPVVIVGGIGMLHGKRLGLARAAAVLAIVPLTSCCCLVGIPIGIWALRVLKNPDVEAHFHR